MTTCKYHTGILSKWVFAAALILSSFAFSGYSKNAKALHQPKAQIELVCSTNKRTTEQTAAYKRIASYQYQSQHYELGILLQQNRLIKTKLRVIFQSSCSIITTRFMQLKMIPPGSTEDLLPAIAG